MVVKHEKPPRGIVPRHIWEIQRFENLCSAIKRYWDAGLKIPIRWIEEYNASIEATGSLMKAVETAETGGDK